MQAGSGGATSGKRIPSLLFCSLLSMAGLVGCGHFQPHAHSYVYVSAREVYLRDRVAAVSNRVALVKNGARLEVLEQGHRFDQVRTQDGKVGWLMDHLVINEQQYDAYQHLAMQHAQDPVVATAQLRDDLYLHRTPGRQTDHFYLVAGNSHVALLERASIPHMVPGAVPAPAAAAGQKTQQAAEIPMEDWWLVRDNNGDTGWLLGSRVDVDIPDAIGEYAEGQRMVADYPLATVTDDGRAPREEARANRHGHRAGRKADREGHAPGAGTAVGADASASNSGTQATATTPRQMTEYLVLLAQPKSGLPYDFDQIRVFTWSLNHHRYETAYRLRGFEGFLPVTITHESVNGLQYPAFTLRIAGEGGSVIDPATGIAHPVAPRTVSFRMEGNIIRRTGADQSPIETRKEGQGDPAAAGKTGKAHKHRR